MYKEADYSKYPLYPTPMFLHIDKEKDEVYNLIKDKSEDGKAIGGYCCLINGEIQKKEPEKAINFHLVRNSSSGEAKERVEGMEMTVVSFIMNLNEGDFMVIYQARGIPVGILIAWYRRATYHGNFRPP